MSIIAAADGSSLGNPGPAGWAWYIDESTWRAGGWPQGTNNMGELKAVLDLLEATAVDADQHLEILCDSQYVINSVTKWMPGWKRKGWKKKDGKPVLNVDLLKAIDQALAGRDVTFTWVKGHAGHRMNEAADERARAAATAYQRRQDPQVGPGYRATPGSTSAAEKNRRPASAQTPAGPGPTASPGEQPREAEADLFSLFDAEPTHALCDADAYLRESPEDEVASREIALLSDTVRASRDAVAGLLHPEFTEIGASGRTWTRDNILQTIAPLGTVDTFDMVTTQIAPAVMLVTYERVIGAERARRSSIWVNLDGEWLLRHHQGTALE